MALASVFFCAFDGVTASAQDAADTGNLRWDLSRPEYDPPETPGWARVTVPEWVKPFKGKNGLPDPWHSMPGSTCSGVVAGIDLYQANHFVAYRPETAGFIYEDYTPLDAGYEPGALPEFERVVKQYTDPEMTETQKALNLLKVALPAVFRHPTMPPLSDEYAKPNRNLMDEDLLASSAGPCNEQARVFIRLCQVAGLQARMVHLFGQAHTLAEFYADGRWVMADVSFHFVPRDDEGNLLSAADCHDRGPGQRAYAESKRRRLQKMAEMSAAELNVSTESLERRRKQWQRFDADRIANSEEIYFGVINYPLPPTN